MNSLKAEVAEKYKLVGVKPGKYQFNGFGEIDLSSISLAEADGLYKLKFPHLVLKKIKTDKPA